MIALPCLGEPLFWFSTASGLYRKSSRVESSWTTFVDESDGISVYGFSGLQCYAMCWMDAAVDSFVLLLFLLF